MAERNREEDYSEAAFPDQVEMAREIVTNPEELLLEVDLSRTVRT